MAEVKWIKIVTDIFDDEKILLIESMPEADGIIVIWFKLLCLAGRQNNSGVFLMNGRIPYTDEMFATIFRRPLNTVRMAMRTFEMYGMIEIINDTVTIPNWSKHQTLDQIERNREYMRDYMRKRREEQWMLTEGKSNCKPNSKDNRKSNVSGADKNREDKNREDKSREEDESKRKRFVPPTQEEVEEYTKEKGYTISAERFIAYYESNGWKVGRNPMKDWKAAVRNWAARDRGEIKTQLDRRPQENPALNYEQREYKAEDYGDDFFMDLDKYGGD